MPQISFHLSDDLVRELRDRLGPDVSPGDVVSEMKMLFLWATAQAASGKAICACDPQAASGVTIQTPLLERASTMAKIVYLPAL